MRYLRLDYYHLELIMLAGTSYFVLPLLYSLLSLAFDCIVLCFVSTYI